MGHQSTPVFAQADVEAVEAHDVALLGGADKGIFETSGAAIFGRTGQLHSPYTSA